MQKVLVASLALLTMWGLWQFTQNEYMISLHDDKLDVMEKQF